MTNKEYKEKRDSIGGFDYWDMFGQDAEKDMRAYNRDMLHTKFAFTNDGLASIEPLVDSNYRARVYRYNDGATLQSYYTDVCKIVFDADGGKTFVPLWNGYSATTMKHINRFRALFGMPALSKREWIEIC